MSPRKTKRHHWGPKIIPERCYRIETFCHRGSTADTLWLLSFSALAPWQPHGGSQWLRGGSIEAPWRLAGFPALVLGRLSSDPAWLHKGSRAPLWWFRGIPTAAPRQLHSGSVVLQEGFVIVMAPWRLQGGLVAFLCRFHGDLAAILMRLSGFPATSLCTAIFDPLLSCDLSQFFKQNA